MKRLSGQWAALAFAALAASHAPVARAGEDYCALLAPADFLAAGVTGARAPTKNPDERGAYCIYAGKSGGTGGIEFDVFVTDGGNDAKAVYAEVRYSGGPGAAKNAVPGADESEVFKVAGSPPYTTIAVRKGKLVFGVSVPTGAKSQEAVTGLAKLVLQRADKLTR